MSIHIMQWILTIEFYVCVHIYMGKLQFSPNEWPFYYLVQWLTILECSFLLSSTNSFQYYNLVHNFCTKLQYHPTNWPLFTISPISESSRLPSFVPTEHFVPRDVQHIKMIIIHVIAVTDFVMVPIPIRSTLPCVIQLLTSSESTDGGHHFLQPW